MDINNNEPKISKLKELIEQLEKPKASRTRREKAIFRLDEGASTCAADNDAYAEAVPLKNKQRRMNGATGYTQQECADGYEAFVNENIDESETYSDNAKGRKKYRKDTARKPKEPEERFQTANQVYDYALNLLTLRDYSKAEILAKLFKKGAPEAFAREAVVKLLEYNFLNEERYAFRVYEMWLNKRVYGRLHLQAELKKRSIEPECIAKVLEHFASELEEQRAEAAAVLFIQQNRKKLQDLQRLLQDDAEPEHTDDFSEAAEVEQEDFGSINSLREGPKKVSKWGSRWGCNKKNKAAERMAALKKIKAAAGRFMAARGFSARYMHIVLCRLSGDNDM